MKIEITKGGDNPVAEFFSSPSKTPETDACAKSIDQSNFEDSWKDDFEEFAWVPADFARQLERERNEAREVASGLAMQEERVNEAQKELSSIHRWIERNHPDGFIDSLTYFQNLERVTDNWYDRLDRLEIDANRFERERDEAREQIKELIYISERAIALAEIDFENDKFGVVSELRDGVERIKEGAK
jgi:chaperonin cofactor prefoldin